MSLFSKRNIDKAKHLFDTNKDKIADGVSKATDTIDKKTGGKHTDKLRKVDEAAKKATGQRVADADATGDAGANAPRVADADATGDADANAPRVADADATGDAATAPPADSDTNG